MGRNVNNCKIIKRFREKDICAELRLLEDGSVSVLLSGGDQSHIGAVYIRNNKNEIIEHSFKGHKDYVLAEEWMEQLGKITSAPIVVTVGIHYDNISMKEIEKIKEISKEMINEGCFFIAIGGNLNEKNS